MTVSFAVQVPFFVFLVALLFIVFKQARINATSTHLLCLFLLFHSCNSNRHTQPQKSRRRRARREKTISVGSLTQCSSSVPFSHTLGHPAFLVHFLLRFYFTSNSSFFRFPIALLLPTRSSLNSLITIFRVHPFGISSKDNTSVSL